MVIPIAFGIDARFLNDGSGMERQSLELNGNQLSMKLMDSSYIMCEDEERHNVMVDVGCRYMSPCWPNPLYSAYYRKILSTYSVGPVLIWIGKRIVGFLPMSVLDCSVPELPLCIHYSGGISYGAERHIDLAMIEKALPQPFSQLERKEIRIGCMNVHPTLKGRNLGELMIHYMVNWARENGWDRVIARATLDGEPLSFYPTHSFWLRAGFKQIGPVRRFGPSNDAIDQSNAVDFVFDLRG
jgi:GNAT superfamily N-acetyltransferase